MPPAACSRPRLPCGDARGEVVGVVGIARDITARRKAEAALRASEARSRVHDQSPAPGVDLTDADGLVVYLSAAFRRTFRLPPGDPVGRTLFHPFPSDMPRSTCRTSGPPPPTA